MKKLNLFLIAIALSFVSYSQTSYKVVTSSYLVYENNDWVRKLSKDNTNESLYVIVNEDKIKFTNESETSFITYGDASHDEYENHKTTTWAAFDNDGNKCYVMIKYPKIPDGKMAIIIIYVQESGKSYEYIVNTKN